MLAEESTITEAVTVETNPDDLIQSVAGLDKAKTISATITNLNKRRIQSSTFILLWLRSRLTSRKRMAAHLTLLNLLLLRRCTIIGIASAAAPINNAGLRKDIDYLAAVSFRKVR